LPPVWGLVGSLSLESVGVRGLVVLEYPERRCWSVINASVYFMDVGYGGTLD
jgi:hypothetical protein